MITRLLGLFIILSFSYPTWAAGDFTKNMSPDAKCMLCGGRILCGAVNEIVELKFGTIGTKKRSVKAHCQGRQELYKNQIAFKGVDTDDKRRFQKLISYFDEVTHNRGGNTKYKLKNGVKLKEFRNYIQPSKKQSRKVFKKLVGTHLILPVVDIYTYKEVIKPPRLVPEYTKYVKDLLSQYLFNMGPIAPGNLIYTYNPNADYALHEAMDEFLRQPASASSKDARAGAAMLALVGSGGSGSASQSPSSKATAASFKNIKDPEVARKVDESKSYSLYNSFLPAPNKGLVSLEDEKGVQVTDEFVRVRSGNWVSPFRMTENGYTAIDYPNYQASTGDQYLFDLNTKKGIEDICHYGQFRNSQASIEGSIRDLVETYEGDPLLQREKADAIIAKTKNSINSKDCTQKMAKVPSSMLALFENSKPAHMYSSKKKKKRAKRSFASTDVKTKSKSTADDTFSEALTKARKQAGHSGDSSGDLAMVDSAHTDGVEGTERIFGFGDKSVEKDSLCDTPVKAYKQMLDSNQCISEEKYKSCDKSLNQKLDKLCISVFGETEGCYNKLVELSKINRSQIRTDHNQEPIVYNLFEDLVTQPKTYAFLKKNSEAQGISNSEEYIKSCVDTSLSIVSANQKVCEVKNSKSTIRTLSRIYVQSKAAKKNVVEVSERKNLVKIDLNDPEQYDDLIDLVKLAGTVLGKTQARELGIQESSIYKEIGTQNLVNEMLAGKCLYKPNENKFIQ